MGTAMRIRAIVFLLAYIAMYVVLFNWYPFFKSKPLAYELIIPSVPAIRALTISLIIWNFVYVTYLYVLTASLVKMVSLRGLGKVTIFGIVLGLASTCIALAIAYPYLVSTGRQLVELARSVYGFAKAMHLGIASYVLNFFVIPALVPIATLYAIKGLTMIRELAKARPVRLALLLVISVLTHDFLEPLVNIAATQALLSVGGAMAALPYYRGYDPRTLEFLTNALREGGTLTPPPWGMVLGSVVFAIVVAMSIEKLVLDSQRYSAPRSA
ncbi:MAG: hypothetical protein GXO32_00260 [Crenarchaeota archaeon]|nr:hypothetical protein [Thermoproteota archaeon]